MSTITETLRRARLAAHISQQELAAALGISPQFLSDIEHGRRDLGAHHYANLPDAVRRVVVKARMVELRSEMRALRALLSPLALEALAAREGVGTAAE